MIRGHYNVAGAQVAGPITSPAAADDRLFFFTVQLLVKTHSLPVSVGVFQIAWIPSVDILCWRSMEELG